MSEQFPTPPTVKKISNSTKSLVKKPPSKDVVTPLLPISPIGSTLSQFSASQSLPITIRSFPLQYSYNKPFYLLSKAKHEQQQQCLLEFSESTAT